MSNEQAIRLSESRRGRIVLHLVAIVRHICGIGREFQRRKP
jgi:hypothetical protein